LDWLRTWGEDDRGPLFHAKKKKKHIQKRKDRAQRIKDFRRHAARGLAGQPGSNI